MTYKENPNIFANWVSYAKQLKRLNSNLNNANVIAAKNKGIITINKINGNKIKALYLGQVSEFNYSRRAQRAELYLRVFVGNDSKDQDTLILDVSEIAHIE